MRKVQRASILLGVILGSTLLGGTFNLTGMAEAARKVQPDGAYVGGVQVTTSPATITTGASLSPTGTTDYKNMSLIYFQNKGTYVVNGSSTSTTTGSITNNLTSSISFYPVAIKVGGAVASTSNLGSDTDVTINGAMNFTVTNNGSVNTPGTVSGVSVEGKGRNAKLTANNDIKVTVINSIDGPDANGIEILGDTSRVKVNSVYTPFSGNAVADFKGKVDITAEQAASSTYGDVHGIYATVTGSKYITDAITAKGTFADEVDIKATTHNASMTSYGIYTDCAPASTGTAPLSLNLSFVGPVDITAKAEGDNSKAVGIYSHNKDADVSGSSSLTFSKPVTIEATSTGTSYGLWIENAQGTMNHTYNDSVKITSKGDNLVYGVKAEDSVQDVVGQTQVDFNKGLEVEATCTTDSSGVIGLYAASSDGHPAGEFSTINVAGGPISITAQNASGNYLIDNAFALKTVNADTTININQDDANLVTIKGSLYSDDSIASDIGPSTINVNATIANSSVQGNLYANGSQGIVNLKLAGSGTYLEGYSNVQKDSDYDAGIINVTMEPTTLWKMTADSTATTLEANNATVNMNYTGTGKYETLTVANLNGSGSTFLMDTDLASETDGDKIVITNSSDGGTQYIQVDDASLNNNTQVTGDKQLLLVTDASGSSVFAGKELDKGGLWDTVPTIEKIGNDWYLTKTAYKPSPSTDSVIGTFESGYGLWRNTILDDTLRKRLGDLRYGAEDISGVWARVKAGKLSADTYDGSYQMYQVGVDKKKDNTAYGLAIDYGRSSNDLTSGTTDGTNTGLSLYATTYHDSGAYNDIVLRAGRLSTDMDVYGAFPDSFDYKAWGYSLGYEVGKTFRKDNGWYVEPQAQLVYGHLRGGDYTTDKGVHVDRDNINSFIGRLGFALGRRINENSDYYVKANVYHEFGGNGDMHLSYGTETMDYDGDHKDTWFEAGIGTNVKVNNNTYFYGDVLKTFGAEISKKWQINAGLRWTWGGAKKVAPTVVSNPVAEPAPTAAPMADYYMDSVHFDTDQDVIRPDQAGKVTHFAEVAKENPSHTFKLVGNTDSDASDSYNEDLSKRRVERVKNAAENQGVPASQIQTNYKGEKDPASSNATAQGKADNRRVDMWEHK